ncbi:hypothetical protein KAI92_05080 [Candidatus Parcubacteria bacterium]|nr:hypothetical protein [Candidatus Parcubacteria bacterium]
MKEEKYMSAMNKPTVHSDYETQAKKEEGDISKRMKEKFDIFKKQFSEMDINEPIIVKAKELLEEYGSFTDVPKSELDIDKSGFDDARLLAFIKVMEEDNRKS